MMRMRRTRQRRGTRGTRWRSRRRRASPGARDGGCRGAWSGGLCSLPEMGPRAPSRSGWRGAGWRGRAGAGGGSRAKAEPDGVWAVRMGEDLKEGRRGTRPGSARSRVRFCRACGGRASPRPARRPARAPRPAARVQGRPRARPRPVARARERGPTVDCARGRQRALCRRTNCASRGMDGEMTGEG